MNTLIYWIRYNDVFGNHDTTGSQLGASRRRFQHNLLQDPRYPNPKPQTWTPQLPTNLPKPQALVHLQVSVRSPFHPTLSLAGGQVAAFLNKCDSELIMKGRSRPIWDLCAGLRPLQSVRQTDKSRFQSTCWPEQSLSHYD